MIPLLAGLLIHRPQVRTVRRISGMCHHRLGDRGVSNRRTIERCTAHRRNSCRMQNPLLLSTTTAVVLPKSGGGVGRRSLATKSQRRKGYDLHSSEPSQQQQKQVINPFQEKKEGILKRGVEINYKILLLVVYPIVMTGVAVWARDDLREDVKERWDKVRNRNPPRKPQQHRRQVDGETQ